MIPRSQRPFLATDTILRGMFKSWVIYIKFLAWHFTCAVHSFLGRDCPRQRGQGSLMARSIMDQSKINRLTCLTDRDVRKCSSSNRYEACQNGHGGVVQKRLALGRVEGHWPSAHGGVNCRPWLATPSLTS